MKSGGLSSVSCAFQYLRTCGVRPVTPGLVPSEKEYYSEVLLTVSDTFHGPELLSNAFFVSASLCSGHDKLRSTLDTTLLLSTISDAFWYGFSVGYSPVGRLNSEDRGSERTKERRLK